MGKEGTGRRPRCLTFGYNLLWRWDYLDLSLRILIVDPTQIWENVCVCNEFLEFSFDACYTKNLEVVVCELQVYLDLLRCPCIV